MNGDLTLIIPIVLAGSICLVVGILMGILLMGLFRPVSSSKPKKLDRDLVEVLRIWRDRQSKQLVLEVGGKIFKKRDELSAKWSTGLVRLSEDLQSWLGMPEIEQRIDAVTVQINQDLANKLPSPLTTEPAKGYQQAGLSPIKPSQVSPTTIRVFSPPMVPGSEPVTTISPPNMEITDILSRAIIPEKSKEAPKPLKSVALQVNEILKEKLVDSPIKNRTIFISEDPGGGVVVFLDNFQYDGINDIPDPEVRQLLRECVTEWELRTG